MYVDVRSLASKPASGSSMVQVDVGEQDIGYVLNRETVGL
jgi:hypothetical protein